MTTQGIEQVAPNKYLSYEGSTVVAHIPGVTDKYPGRVTCECGYHILYTGMDTLTSLRSQGARKYGEPVEEVPADRVRYKNPFRESNLQETTREIADSIENKNPCREVKLIDAPDLMRLSLKCSIKSSMSVKMIYGDLPKAKTSGIVYALPAKCSRCHKENAVKKDGHICVEQNSYESPFVTREKLTNGAIASNTIAISRCIVNMGVPNSIDIANTTYSRLAVSKSNPHGLVPIVPFKEPPKATVPQMEYIDDLVCGDTHLD